jgi:lamin tail-like protein
MSSRFDRCLALEAGFARLACPTLLAVSSACSDLPPPPIGQLSLGLSSGVGDAQYKLTQASFSIEGAAELTLSSEDDPAVDSVQRTLLAGDYSVRLLDGWQLQRLGPAGGERVEAELASANPLPFSILSGELTTVTFQFRTLGGGAGGGSEAGGELRIAIEVDGATSPHVVISELMKNPEALPDADGEWIELYNASSQPLDLGGCSLARDTQELAFDGALSLDAGAYLTLANGDTPGFTPDLVYSGLTLPNSGAFVLRLACGDQVLDAVTVDPSLSTQRAGHSLSLSGAAMDELANDDATRWCEGAASYDGDFGTPGAPNPDCTP